MKKNDKIKEEKSRITKIAENVKKVSAKTGGFSKYVKDTVINKMLESETSDLDNFIANDEILNKIFPEPKAAKTSQIKKEALPIRDILSRKTSALSKMANSSAAKPNEFEGELNDLSQYMGDRLSKVGFKAVKSHYESIFTNEDYVGKAVEHGQYSSKLVIDNVLDKLTTIRDSINTENLNEEDLGIAQEKAQLLDDKIDELKNHPERDVEGQKEKIMGSLREQRMSTLEKKAVNKFSTFEYLTKEGEKELSPINAESTKTSDLVFGRTNAEYLKQGYAAKMREHLNFGTNKKEQVIKQRQSIIDEVGQEEYKKSNLESKLFHPKIVGIEDKIKAANVQTTINTQEVDKKEKTASRIRGSVDAVKELARGISEMGRQIGGVRRQYR